jgi:hypothetical protein
MRAFGERTVQAEPVTNKDIARRHRRAEVSGKCVQEIHELVLIDRHLFLLGLIWADPRSTPGGASTTSAAVTQAGQAATDPRRRTAVAMAAWSPRSHG